MQRSLAEVSINQRPVVDTSAAAENKLVVQERGRPGKSDARLEILVVRVGPGFASVAVAARSVSGKDQSPRKSTRTRIRCGWAEDGGVAVRFVARRVITPAQSEVEGEVTSHLPVVLYENCSSVRNPARRMNLTQGVCGTRLTHEECGEGVAVTYPVRGVGCRLVGPEGEASRSATAGAPDFADERILVILHFPTKVEAVRPMLPVNHIVQGKGIVHILGIVVLAEIRIGAAVEHKPGKDRTEAVGDSELAIPVSSRARGRRQVVVVGAVAAERHRINQRRT